MTSLQVLRRNLCPLLRRTYSTFEIPPPSWSVRTLLPGSPESPGETTPTIPPDTLSHLLRLSALSPPVDPASLHDHLHFVRSLATVPTTGVVPLAAIRDEVNTAQLEYSYADITGAQESISTEKVGDGGRVAWDPVAGAKRRVGGYFVVDEAAEEELVKPENEKD